MWSYYDRFAFAAIDLRRNVWETSKLLKSALDHVEEIDDEDEARILREPMDALQVHVKKALQMVSSPADTKTSKASGTPSSSSSTSTAADTHAKALPIPTGFAARSAAGTTMPSGTPPGLSGSLNRHPLGLFSTSPNFGAQSPFASPKRLSAARFPSTPITALSDSEVDAEAKAAPPPPPAVIVSDPLTFSTNLSNNISNNSSNNNNNNNNSSSSSSKSKSTKENVPTAKSRPRTTNGLSTISLDDGPLSIATTPVPTTAVKSTAKHNRADTSLNSAATSSSFSSFASFSTALSSPLDTPISPPTNAPNKPSLTQSSPQRNTNSENKSGSPESKVPKSLDAVRGHVPVRRVPRGLFSTSSTISTSEAEPNHSNGHSHDNETVGHTLGKTPVASMNQVVTTLAQESFESPTRGRTPTRALSPGCLSASRPQSPPTPSTPSNGPRSPNSPRLQRSQPKPSPIHTVPNSPATGQFPRNEMTSGEEQMSQLAKDLERAMNPTPTEPVPQTYFLQGKGLLERIPNQDSTDDVDDQDDQYSEDSDRNDGQTAQDGAPGLSRGSGSLRRQRSGGKRRFRISRSRSRNRSKGRQERNKPDLPIEIGYTSALASSEWPFGNAPTQPPSQSSLSALQQQQLQRQRNASMSAAGLRQQQLQQQGGAHQRSASQPTSSLHQQHQPRTGPRLPFAESVTVSNPIRVGRGIGSFTVYNVSLTLCDPAKAKVPLPPRQNQNQNQNQIKNGGDRLSSASTAQDQHTSLAPHAGHADAQGSDPLVSSSSLNSPPATTINMGTTSNAIAEAPLRPPPSKAALMMTRSLSFPQLGDSAERLLMEMRSLEEDDGSAPPPLPWRPLPTTAAPLATRPSHANTEAGFGLPPLLRPQSAPIPSPPPLPFRGSERGTGGAGGRAMQGLDATISRATSAQQVTAAHGQGYVSPPIPTRVVTGFTPVAPISSSSTSGPGSAVTQAPPRVIHVRKRYTDFVTLRAQLVETFREPRKGGIGNARRLFSRSSSSSVVPSIHASPSGGNPLSGGHRVSPFMSHDEDEDYNDEDDDDDNEDGTGYSSHSRMASSTSVTSTSSQQSASGSIIRGMPKLPPKKVVGKFRPAFVEKRRRELEYFLEWVVAHPIMGDSPVVVQWFLGPTASPTL
ncbi:hypothetical protein BGZ88_008887 [Linnemannia elongata]|nr:hypothetical protein BGZ88_008887 [Linnemannia elongata]